MDDDVVRLLPARRGHFRLESGHHGDLWLDLERLCLRPEPVRRMAGALATRLSRHDVGAVCGPLVDGAFVALLVALELGVQFTYAERLEAEGDDGLYPVAYRIPDALRAEVRGKRVAIVNDVVNAGSAVRGAFHDLGRCGAETVALATLMVLGSWSGEFAAENGLALETLASVPNEIWVPSACPLCARGVPLTTTAPGEARDGPD